MTQCVINGIQISFPYQPYDVQKHYMTKVIECLQNELNGILESPTGTGKTLSLLCSSLAWLENKKAQQQLLLMKDSLKTTSSGILNSLKSVLDGINGQWNNETNFMLPKIIYCSRTHSQLSQAVNELKRSNYNYAHSVVLGSRDHLCLHVEVSKITNHTTKAYACRAKISSKSCPFYLNYEEKIATQKDYQDSTVLDIEDLITLGKKNMVCPYFAVRNLKAKSDIIFTPYNYIIDPKSRRSHGIELEGNVIIIDEAHNIEGACEESMSFQLRSYDLALCISEVTQTIETIKKHDKDISSSDDGVPDFTLEDLFILKVMFCELEDILDKEVAECSKHDGSKPGDFILELLSKVELNLQKKDIVLELLDKIILYNSSNTGNLWSSKGAGLQKFSDLVTILFSKISNSSTVPFEVLKREFAKKYRIFLQYETKSNKGQNNVDSWNAPLEKVNKKQSWKLDFWCFSPAIAMKDITDRNIHSIILTSGTLSPLGPMITELGTKFPIQLENPHIITDEQIFVAVLNCGPDGTPLNSSFQNRSNERYINSLGRTISNFSKQIPDGLLVFFPSYSVMKSNINKWEETGIWQTLSGIKQLFIEPQGKDAFQESIENYYSTINDCNSKGATLLAVCRGKVSEGLDFADKNARAVIITGLPYPPIMDQRVKMKMNYLNANVKETNGLCGNDWYVLQASRAVNQAIGRVIRHKDDYGAILLCDNRFKDKRIQRQLSKWIQGRIQIFDAFGPALRHLSIFFKALGEKPIKTNSSLKGFQMNATLIQPKDSNKTTHHSTSISHQHGWVEKYADGNIFESYCSSIESKEQIQKPGSIFDAIDKTSSSGINSINFQASTSKSFVSLASPLNVSSSNLSQIKDNKRRKISIKLQGADYSEEPEKTVAEIWRNNLNKIKAVLCTTEKYGKFCSSVKEFKLSKNTETFAYIIKNIFLDVPDKQSYFEMISKLLNFEEREKFLDICNS